MGARKTEFANRLKEERKKKYFAVLRNCPSSPRKMRYVVDMIRGIEVNRALDILKYSNKEAASKVEKLLLSAIANWQTKNEGTRVEDSNLFVKEVFVDGGRMLKRMKTAPQGRAYRIRKRSNHVTLIIDSAIASSNESKTE
jgi:large subunit ribosomal protein L22